MVAFETIPFFSNEWTAFFQSFLAFPLIQRFWIYFFEQITFNRTSTLRMNRQSRWLEQNVRIYFRILLTREQFYVFIKFLLKCLWKLDNIFLALVSPAACIFQQQSFLNFEKVIFWQVFKTNNYFKSLTYALKPAWSILACFSQFPEITVLRTEVQKHAGLDRGRDASLLCASN